MLKCLLILIVIIFNVVSSDTLNVRLYNYSIRDTSLFYERHLVLNDSNWAYYDIDIKDCSYLDSIKGLQFSIVVDTLTLCIDSIILLGDSVETVVEDFNNYSSVGCVRDFTNSYQRWAFASYLNTFVCGEIIYNGGPYLSVKAVNYYTNITPPHKFYLEFNNIQNWKVYKKIILILK